MQPGGKAKTIMCTEVQNEQNKKKNRTIKDNSSDCSVVVLLMASHSCVRQHRCCNHSSHACDWGDKYSPHAVEELCDEVVKIICQDLCPCLHPAHRGGVHVLVVKAIQKDTSPLATVTQLRL